METAPEILENAKLTTSGFDEERMEALALGEGVLEVLGRYEPLSMVLPWDIYMQMPLIESVEVDLVYGKQSAHIHVGGVIIRFWKPKKDVYWYDFDTFKFPSWTYFRIYWLGVGGGERFIIKKGSD